MSSDALLQRLEAVVSQLERVASRLGGAGAGGDEEKSAAVIEFDQFVASHVKPFVDNCNRLDGLKPLGALCDTAFNEMRKVIDAAAHCKKPSNPELMKFLAPLSKVVEDAQKTDNRSRFFNNQKAFAEFIQLVNWVLIPAPAQHIRSTLEAADFYLNKILSAAKDAPEPEKEIQRAFVAGIKSIINDLADYTKNNFAAGLLWNPKGIDLSQFNGSGAAAAPAAPASEGAAPPPPPPVDPNFKLDVSSAPATEAPKQAGGMSAVFGQISQGEGITAGLKKVTSDMKSKNRKDDPVLEPKEPKEPKETKKAIATVTKPVAAKKDPALELRQGTWFVEYYDGVDVEVPDVQMKQNVFVFKARNCTVNIPAKCKSIQLDGCFKARIVFTNVVSSFEVVNSERVTIVVNELCPNMALDKSSGIQILLNEQSVKEPPVIITSNTTEVNLVVPGKQPQDDPIELPLPQQFQTVYKDYKVHTEPVSHSGA